VHGPSAVVLTSEDQPRRPFGDYGIQKAAIEAYLLGMARRCDLPVIILHPGHIVGPCRAHLSPAGHFIPAVFARLARGEEVVLPNLGMKMVVRQGRRLLLNSPVPTLSRTSLQVTCR
jgi:nucleoside-diphosphate-sugar epimerase